MKRSTLIDKLSPGARRRAARKLKTEKMELLLRLRKINRILEMLESKKEAAV